MNLLSSLLGLGVEPKDLALTQIGLRCIIVFAWSLLLVRISDRRSLTKKSPFDIILVVILASVLARAINGNSNFFATLGGAGVFVLLHRALAFFSARWLGITAVIKGRPAVLVANGKLQHPAMRRADISRPDIEEDMRLSAHIEDLQKVTSARLEVNGEVSFILAESTK